MRSIGVFWMIEGNCQIPGGGCFPGALRKEMSLTLRPTSSTFAQRANWYEALNGALQKFAVLISERRLCKTMYDGIATRHEYLGNHV